MNEDKKTSHLARLKDDSEKVIERLLVQKVLELGGDTVKMTLHAQAGFPDRLCIFPRGLVVWVEIKSRGQTPSALQKFRIRSLKALGQWVEVIDTKQGVELLISSVKRILAQ